VDRRNFLKASTLTAGATLLPNILEQAHTAQRQDLRMLPMNRGWRFSSKVVEGDTSREFDDTAFERIVIPHTNKGLPWHSFCNRASTPWTSGHRPGGLMLNQSLQDAIDHAFEAGGGTVSVPPGIFLTGGLVLCSIKTKEPEHLQAIYKTLQRYLPQGGSTRCTSLVFGAMNASACSVRRDKPA
jgi:hypothetical protein